MTFGRLLLRNLLYHWRANLAVLLGVCVGTAVLTGALLVGDSLRGSLHQLMVRQLGNVDYALVAGRLLRQELAEEIAHDKAAAAVRPALMLQGAVTTRQGEGADAAGPRAGRVTILGVDANFWRLWPNGRAPQGEDFWSSAKKEVVLNRALARELNVAEGDTVTLHLQKMSAIPRESILGRKEASEVVYDVDMRIAAVLANDMPGARFQLNPSPATPRNLFAPLAALQQELVQTRGNQPASHLQRPVNLLLAHGGSDRLQASLAKNLTLDDWGLVLRGPARRARDFFKDLHPNRRGLVLARNWPRLKDIPFPTPHDTLTEGEFVAYYQRHHNYLSLESRQLFLENAVARAARDAAADAGLIDAPTLVYLADRVAGDRGKEMSYAVVAALDPALPPPLGPFLPPGVTGLANNEIILVDWPGSALPPRSGAHEVRLTYYEPEEQEKPATRILSVAGWIPLQGAADDPSLTPEFPGITDQASLDTWDPPASMHYRPERVRKPQDEDFWRSYRATPKAYVNLATGKRLWSSRFGSLTSIRLALRDPARRQSSADLARARVQFRRALLQHLRPEEAGLAFDAVRRRADEASAGSEDFQWLFPSFSVFLIAAAVLLVGLLFRLNLERRGAEIGLLFATGFRRGTVRALLLAEGAVLAIAGALLGCAAALLYAGLLLDYLRAWWPGGLERAFLHLHATAQSFLLGFGGSLGVSLLAIAWAVHSLSRVAPRALLAGETAAAPEAGEPARPGRWRWWVGGIALAGALACVAAGPWVSNPEGQAMTFFGSGLLLLVAGLVGVWAFLKRRETAPTRSVAVLGIRNAGRHPVRSLLTVGLLASATFLIIAVESFHKNPETDFAERGGGSGGFSLLAESEVPLYQPLESKEGRAELDYLAKLARLPARDQALLRDVTYYSFRLRSGDDVSCLNLARPRRPRLLGLSSAFIRRRGGFRFAASEASTPRQRQNPWLLLRGGNNDEIIPAIADATAAQYGIKRGLGETLDVSGENGQPVRLHNGRQIRLRIVGLLQDSIFQSELLISDKNFRRLYPHQGGYNFFLIDAPPADAAPVKNVLERALASHGFTVTPTFRRMETYLAVENTYLSTFQALGGLGLLLGALGLAVVLLRSVWERRGELALLRAVGYRRSTLGWLVLAENGFLLVLGLGVGAVTALVAVAPHVLSGVGDLPWLRMLGLLALVLVVGLLAGVAAVASTLKAPLIPALRRE
jgi:ABC-type lipoprotein release transport system permease subunit